MDDDPNAAAAGAIVKAIEDMGAKIFFEKPLTASDASGSGRVVVPKVRAWGGSGVSCVLRRCGAVPYRSCTHTHTLGCAVRRLGCGPLVCVHSRKVTQGSDSPVVLTVGG